MNVRVIKLNRLDSRDAAALKSLLDKLTNENCELESDVTYNDAYRLSDNIVRIEKHNPYTNETEIKYYIYNTLNCFHQNKNSTRSVYRISSKLIFNPDGSFHLKPYAGFLKITGRDDGAVEARFSTKIDYLHAQAPAFKTRYAYLVTKKLRGDVALICLGYTDNQNLDNKNTPITIADLSALDLINLARALMYSFRDRIYNRSIFHKDVKPANSIIAVYPINNGVGNFRFKVRWIDFGLSTMAGGDFFDQERGTFGYIAPEAFAEDPNDRHQSAKADIWSLAMFLCEVFGAEQPQGHAKVIDKIGAKNFTDIRTKITTEIQTIIKSLFSRFDLKAKFSEAERLMFKDLFQRMLEPEEAKRPDWNDLIVEWDKLRSQHICNHSSLDKSQIKEMADANNAARLAYSKLEQLSTYLCTPGHTPPIHKGPEGIRSILNEALFLKLDNKEVAKFPSAFAIKEFIEVVQIKAFIGLTSIREIKAKMNRIIDEYIKNLKYLLDCSKYLETNEDKVINNESLYADSNKLSTQLLKTFEKVQKRRVTLDKLALLNHKIKTMRREFDPKLNKFEKKMKEFQADQKRNNLVLTAKLSKMNIYTEKARRQYVRINEEHNAVELNPLLKNSNN